MYCMHKTMITKRSYQRGHMHSVNSWNAQTELINLLVWLQIERDY